LKYLILLLFLPTFATAEQFFSVQDRLDGLLTDAQESCADDGGDLKLLGNEIVRYDFENDGVTDLTILNEYEYKCSSSASLYQGTAGAVIHLMTDKDYFYGYARQFKVFTAFKNKQVILLDLHGSSCDEAGYISCFQAITLNDGLFIYQ
jgi:hypothetical protein